MRYPQKTLFFAWRVLLVLSVGWQFQSCSSSVPVRRIHNAASILRTVDLGTAAFENQETTQGVHMNVSSAANYGSGWNDQGASVSGLSIVPFNIKLSLQQFRVGWMPYWTDVRGNYDDTAHWGFRTYVNWNYFRGEEWSFSLQPAYQLAMNNSVDKGCKDGAFTIFGDSCSKAKEIYYAHSRIRIRDYSLSFIQKKKLGEHAAFAISPSFYYTQFQSVNTLDGGDATENTRIGHKKWNYGLLLHYLYQPSSAVYVMGIGVHTQTGFGKESKKTRFLPAADLKIHF